MYQEDCLGQWPAYRKLFPALGSLCAGGRCLDVHQEGQKYFLLVGEEESGGFVGFFLCPLPSGEVVSVFLQQAREG